MDSAYLSSTNVHFYCAPVLLRDSDIGLMSVCPFVHLVLCRNDIYIFFPADLPTYVVRTV